MSEDRSIAEQFAADEPIVIKLSVRMEDKVFALSYEMPKGLMTTFPEPELSQFMSQSIEDFSNKMLQHTGRRL